MTVSDSLTCSSESVWREYHQALQQFVRRRVGDLSTADDILQDVFVKVHKRIHTLKDSSRLQSWIYQITRNAIVDHYRSQRKMEELPDTLITPEDDPTEVLHRELAECMLPLIESLPAPYREALLLSEIEGLPHREVARRQGISLPAAKARVRRGRQQLKDQFTDCCEFALDGRGNILDYAPHPHTIGGCPRCEGGVL